MVAFNAGPFSIRLWVNPGGSDLNEAIERMNGLAPTDWHAQEDRDAMEKLLLESLEPEHRIAAYEITGFDRCGVVGYVEWP